MNNTTSSSYNTQTFENKVFNINEKTKDVRRGNIIAAKCI
jgi:hypothetical protein